MIRKCIFRTLLYHFKDFNECDLDDSCNAGECINTVGGFQCECPEGYKSIMGGKACEDVRVAACHRHYNASNGECSDQMFEVTKKQCCCFENIGGAWNNPCEVIFFFFYLKISIFSKHLIQLDNKNLIFI